MRNDSPRLAPRPARGLPGWRRLMAALILLPLLALGCSGSVKDTSGPTPAVQPDVSSVGGSAGPVEVEDVYIPPPPSGVYPAGSGVLVSVTMRSDGPAWDSVVAGSSPVSQQVALSQYNIDQDFLSVPNDDQPVEGVVQLHGISRQLSAGTDVPLTLRFASGDSLSLQVPVRRSA